MLKDPKILIYKLSPLSTLSLFLFLFFFLTLSLSSLSWLLELPVTAMWNAHSWILQRLLNVFFMILTTTEFAHTLLSCF